MFKSGALGYMIDGGIFMWPILFLGVLAAATALRAQEPSKAVIPPESSLTGKEFREAVRRAKEYIKAGDIFQVVPSQRFSAPFTRKPISFYRALRRLNPSAFMFHMNLGSVCLVGSSPEILVRVRDGRVAIRPIAGTRPRSGAGWRAGRRRRPAARAAGTNRTPRA